MPSYFEQGLNCIYESWYWRQILCFKSRLSNFKLTSLLKLTRFNFLRIFFCIYLRIVIGYLVFRTIWNYFLIYLVQFSLKWLKVSCLLFLTDKELSYKLSSLWHFTFCDFDQTILVLDRCYFQTSAIITKSSGIIW